MTFAVDWAPRSNYILCLFIVDAKHARDGRNARMLPCIIITRIVRRGRGEGGGEERGRVRWGEGEGGVSSLHARLRGMN